MSKLVLGLNTHHGDAAAALVGPSGPIAAIAEERLNRKKHFAGFPKEAIREVLRIASASLNDVTDIVVARDPRANPIAKAAFLLRHPRAFARTAARRMEVHSAVRSTSQLVASELGLNEASIVASFHQVEHHLAHVASAYYSSPFESASGFSLDGAGDFATSLFANCEGTRIQPLHRDTWPHSLGVFYTAVCQFIGFDRYGEEFKVMGLSAYGENRYSSLMRELVRYDIGRGLVLNLDYFQHHLGEELEQLEDGVVRLPRLYSDKLASRLGPPRNRSHEIGQREMDLAASMQCRYEEVFLDMVQDLKARTGKADFALAGGCVLNSVANGRMLTEGYVDRAYFQPAATDDGTALGAAQWVLHNALALPRTASLDHAFLGPDWPDSALEQALEAQARPYVRLSRKELLDRAAQSLAKGDILGWFQGREEWGPRALGNRSILCNPALKDMKDTLNARIKRREKFRPFAPVVREKDLSRYFAGEHEVPFMIVVYKVRPEWRERLSAITHVDGTGRVQTVRQEQNPLYFDLLTRFEQETGFGVLLNTSFNENEPIVHTPSQALECFERTRMDCLALGPYWLDKAADRQPE